MAKKPVQVPGATPEQAPDAAAEQPKATPEQAPKAGGLPDIADIDPTKISRSVLTKQGWVCPA